MADASTSLLASRYGDTIILQVTGQITAEFCPALKKFCAGEHPNPSTKVQVHLQDCSHFDSTFLGTLLCLRGRFGEDGVVLVSPGEECRAGLKRMGAHLLFPIRDEPLPDDIEWTTLTDRAVSRDTFDFQHNVVEAHVELARTPGPMQKVYEPIARQAEQEFAEKHGWDSLTVIIPKP